MQCNHYKSRERCPNNAEYLLYDHENLPIPGACIVRNICQRLSPSMLKNLVSVGAGSPGAGYG